jgi:hypothetical protein
MRSGGKSSESKTVRCRVARDATTSQQIGKLRLRLRQQRSENACFNPEE